MLSRERDNDTTPPLAVLGITILIFVLPIFFAFQDSGPTLGIFGLLIGTLVILWTARILPALPAKPAIAWTVFGLVITAQTLFVTHQMFFSQVSLLWWWIGISLFIVMLSLTQISGLDRLWWRILLITQAASAVAALVIFFLHPQRTFGWLTNANGLGGYLLWGIMAGLALLLHHRRWWVWLLLITIGAAWILTISLTAFIAALIPIGILVWSQYRRWPWRNVIVSLAVLAVISSGFGWWWSSTGHPVLQNTANIRFSFSQRWEFNLTALRMWRDRPWLGWGAGTFKQTVPRYTHQIAEQPLYVHNTFAQVLVEHGLIGFALFITLVGWIGWKGWRATFGSGRESSMALNAFYAGWLAFTIHASLDFSWYFPAGQFWWWTISALWLSREVTASTWTLNRRQVWVPAVLIAVGLWLFSGRSLAANYLADRGQTAMRANDLDRGIPLTRQAIRYSGNPQDVTYQAQLLLARNTLADRQEARQELLKSVRHNSDDYFLYQSLGQIELSLKNIPGALDASAKAYFLDSKFHPTIIMNYASTLARSGRTSEAHRVVSQALQLYRSIDGSASNQLIVPYLHVLEQLEQVYRQ